MTGWVQWIAVHWLETPSHVSLVLHDGQPSCSQWERISGRRGNSLALAQVASHACERHVLCRQPARPQLSCRWPCVRSTTAADWPQPRGRAEHISAGAGPRWCWTQPRGWSGRDSGRCHRDEASDRPLRAASKASSAQHGRSLRSRQRWGSVSGAWTKDKMVIMCGEVHE